MMGIRHLLFLAGAVASCSAGYSLDDLIYEGCYADVGGGGVRVIPMWMGWQAKQSPMWCLEACQARSPAYDIIGIQAKHYCFCGTSRPARALKRSEGECSQSCPDPDYSDQKCGGGWRNSVYRLKGANSFGLESMGCYTDAMERTLNVNLGAYNDNTPENCARRCLEKDPRLVYSGVEWMWECHCAAEKPAADRIAANQADCNTKCTGSPLLSCGGGWRVEVSKATYV